MCTTIDIAFAEWHRSSCDAEWKFTASVETSRVREVSERILSICVYFFPLFCIYFSVRRRKTKSIYDNSTMLPEWSEYLLQSKRSHLMMPTANGHIFASYPPLFDYSVASSLHADTFSSSLDKVKPDFLCLYSTIHSFFDQYFLFSLSNRNESE